MALASLWIKTAASLPRHPKVKKAAEMLGINVPEIIGRLVMLWIYALEFRSDGIFENAEEVAAAMNWTATTPEELRDALAYCGGFNAGFIEAPSEHDGGRIRLHHWGDFSGAGVNSSGVKISYKKREEKREENIRKENAGSTAQANLPLENSSGTTNEHKEKKKIKPIDANHEAWLKSLGKI